jgi:hypothetical protein
MGRYNNVDNTKAKAEIGWQTPILCDGAMSCIRDWVNSVYSKSIIKVLGVYLSIPNVFILFLTIAVDLH